jgi:hypothetical protein
LGFKLSLDQNEVKAAFFTIDQRGTFSFFHILISPSRSESIH